MSLGIFQPLRHLLAPFLWGAACALSWSQAGIGNWIYTPSPYSFWVVALSLFFVQRELFALPLQCGARRAHLRWIYFTIPSAWAFGFFLIGLHWIGNALLIEGNPFFWAWPFAVAGLPLLLCSVYGVIAGGGVLAARQLAATYVPSFSQKLEQSTALQCMHFCVLFFLAECTRSYAFTGFPWITFGTYWSETDVMFQVAHWTGLQGLSALTLLWACTLGAVLMRKIRFWSSLPLILTAVFFACVSAGFHRLMTPVTLDPSAPTVVLIQASTPQSERFDPEKITGHVRDHLRLSQEAITSAHNPQKPLILIWPESILPPWVLEDPAFTSAVFDLLKTAPVGSVLLSGAWRRDENGRYYNSLIPYHLTPDGPAAQAAAPYDKAHLVPFGEYMPFENILGLGSLSGFEGLTAGSGPQTLSLKGLPPFRPLICYEIIFPKNLLTNRQNERWIVTITNDAWYGNTLGPRQHLIEARARAIESGLPVVRVASTGISAVIDSRGMVTAQIPYDQRATVLMPLPLELPARPAP